MSEYQYYEFVAVDRALDATQLAQVRSLSTRARITSTSFVNTYEWGNFRGDPRVMMERYYDAHLYLTNWGTRRLMLRLPVRLLDPNACEQYCVGDAASTWTHGDHVIVDLIRDGYDEDEYDEFDEDGEGSLSSIIPARAALAGGDLRLLYLAWLRCVQSNEADDEQLEPPVPAGLGALSASLSSLVDFLRIDPDLVAAAATASPPVAPHAESPAELDRWVTGLSVREKDTILRRLVSGDDAHLRTELLRSFQTQRSGESTGAPTRTTAQLRTAAAAARHERERRIEAQRARERAHREQAATAARERRLAKLASDQEGAWQQVDALIETRKPGEYDAAVKILTDLCTIAERAGDSPKFRDRLAQLRHLHARKSSLLDRLDRARLLR